jgi:hypothetical protein
VDPGAKTYPRTFRVYGTGHNLPDDPGQYVGTFQIHNEGLVFHVFEANDQAYSCLATNPEK